MTTQRPINDGSSEFFGNPFSTRYTQPGRIAPMDGFGRLLNLHGILASLAELGGTAAIQGPHGSGKTTLLEHLACALQHRGVCVVRVRLRGMSDALKALLAIAQSPPGGMVCIDSWEQMGRLLSSLARGLAWVRGCHVLVTSHRVTGLPLLIDCQTSHPLLVAIVRQLPSHEIWHGQRIAAADVEEAFEQCGGNMRESLYHLYDRFERHGREVPDMPVMPAVSIVPLRSMKFMKPFGIFFAPRYPSTT